MKTKSLLLSIAIIMAFTVCKAQGPTLTFSNSGIQPGDNINTYSADTSGFGIEVRGAFIPEPGHIFLSADYHNL